MTSITPLEFNPLEEPGQILPDKIGRREFLRRVGGGVVVLFATAPRFVSGDSPPAGGG